MKKCFWLTMALNVKFKFINVVSTFDWVGMIFWKMEMLALQGTWEKRFWKSVFEWKTMHRFLCFFVSLKNLVFCYFMFQMFKENQTFFKMLHNFLNLECFWHKVFHNFDIKKPLFLTYLKVFNILCLFLLFQLLSRTLKISSLK